MKRRFGILCINYHSLLTNQPWHSIAVITQAFYHLILTQLNMISGHANSSKTLPQRTYITCHDPNPWAVLKLTLTGNIHHMPWPKPLSGTQAYPFAVNIDLQWSYLPSNHSQADSCFSVLQWWCINELCCKWQQKGDKLPLWHNHSHAWVTS